MPSSIAFWVMPVSMSPFWWMGLPCVGRGLLVGVLLSSMRYRLLLGLPGSSRAMVLEQDDCLRLAYHNHAAASGGCSAACATAGSGSGSEAPAASAGAEAESESVMTSSRVAPLA